MSVNDYLERAKRHEAQESWNEALYLYERAIAQLADEGNPDPALHSRVGDLQLRLNRPKAAAAAYEESVELYIRHTDLDGAFAVCQKILRHLPELDDVYLRIARIRAMQGYTEWARQHYLTYAQLKGAKGERDVAVRVLEELVAVVPDDVDTRLFVSERLIAEGRRADALMHLEEGYRRSVAAGDNKAAARVRERLRSLEPETVFGDLVPEGEGEATQPAFEASEIVGRNVPKPRKSGSLARLLGALGIGRSAPPPPEPEAVPLPEEGEGRPVWERAEEEARVQEAAYEAAAAGMDADAFARNEPSSGVIEEPPGAAELEYVGGPASQGSAEEAEDAWEKTKAGDLSWEKRGADDVDDESESSEPLGVGSAESAHAAEVEPAAEGAAALAPEATRRDDVDRPREGSPSAVAPAAEGVRAAETVQPVSEEEEMAAEEAAVLKLLADEPFVVAHHERFVRYAAKRNDRELLIEGLFHMAIALRASGLEWRAKSTLARIMSMDPGHARALEALGYGQPGAASDPFLRGAAIDPGAVQPAAAGTPAAPAHGFAESARTETPATSPFLEPLHPAGIVPGATREPEVSEEGYVDLAAMILDDMPEPSTRWQVEFTEPPPNEEADFGKILAQFKDQVSKHLERSDARAHYDLGSAYKGMGLVHEAIAMFQKALRADPEFLPAIEVLGRCFLDLGDADAGIKVLNRGLEVKVPVEDDLLGVYYYLGNAYEMVGNPAAARDYYMKVFARDINFLDVTDRLRGLRREVADAVTA
jgi:tetratricopeptide (TPR) repeat protein